MLWRAPSWERSTYWALDLETSGLDPREDAIVSVGMVPIRSASIRWGERFASLVRPDGQRAPSAASLDVHQILPGEVALAPELAVVMREVAERLGGGVLLVHHAALDVGFLRAAFRRVGRRWPRPRVVDTAVLLERLARRRERLRPYPEALPRGLAEAREWFQLPPHTAHRALDDAFATAELFLVLRARLGARSLRQLT